MVLTLLIIILLTGLGLYWLVRHPIKSLKFLGALTGLLLLGSLGLAAAGFVVYWLLT